MRRWRNAARTTFASALMIAAVGPHHCYAQADIPDSSPGITRQCVILFDQDARRPARVEDAAEPCLRQAKQALGAHADLDLYLVATADQAKDNEAGHGHSRTEQDMTGEDLRYADVAAYRAINTKAYLVTWLRVDPARVIPLTTYQDGQWVALYLVRKDVSFRQAYSRETAPILSRPCTVKPCATGPEEFLLPQQRERIARK